MLLVKHCDAMDGVARTVFAFVEGDVLWSENSIRGGDPFRRATPSEEQRALLARFMERIVARQVALSTEFCWYSNGYEVTVQLEGDFAQVYFQNRQRPSTYTEPVIQDLFELLEQVIPEKDSTATEVVAAPAVEPSHCRFQRH